MSSVLSSYQELLNGMLKEEQQVATFSPEKQNDNNIINRLQKDFPNLEAEIPYFVAMIKVEHPNGIPKNVVSFTKEYFMNSQPEIIVLTYSDCLVILVPTSLDNSVFAIRSSKRNIVNFRKYQEEADRRFKFSLSIGIGEPYPLQSFNHSFKEALIAVTLNQLLNKNGRLQEYKELGVYYFIFSRDIESIKDYCLKIVGPLIQHDSVTGSDLFNTLRNVLDSNYNLKSASQNLFLHINTLHYRLKKIEQLLNIDLSVLSTRIDLFTAVKVWDTLRTLSYVKDFMPLY